MFTYLFTIVDNFANKALLVILLWKSLGIAEEKIWKVVGKSLE